MPSTSFHVKRRHLDYLDQVVDEHPDVHNPSQALKMILDEDMNRDDDG